MTISAGTKLGPYEILGLLGAGGMGEVYRARDERLKREVAIKVLPASFSQDAERLRRFEQEAQTAGGLNHPNITAVYDLGSRGRRAVHRDGASRGRDVAGAALGRGAAGPRRRPTTRSRLRAVSPPRTRKGSCTGT